MRTRYDDRWYDGHSPAEEYQRAHERQAVEDRLLGRVPPDGWRRPVDPPCPKHGYGMVGPYCGVCVQLLEAQRRAA